MKLYQKILSYEDVISPGISTCSGCCAELAIRTALSVFGRNSVVGISPGCIAATCIGIGKTRAAKIPVFHTLLDNSAAMMAGVKLYFNKIKRNVHVIAVSGDGATADVGFQALSAAAERGDPIIYICYDNEGYMNTGIQRSGTTPKGAWTTTTPVGKFLKGKTRDKKDVPLTLIFSNAAYVATATPAFMDDFLKKLEKAKKIDDGLVYIHVLTPCPRGWRFPPEKTITVSRLAVQTRYFPLFEARNGRIRITKRIIKPKPLKDFIKIQGRFSHLTDEDISEIEKSVQRKWELLNKLSELS